MCFPNIHTRGKVQVTLDSLDERAFRILWYFTLHSTRSLPNKRTSLESNIGSRVFRTVKALSKFRFAQRDLIHTDLTSMEYGRTICILQ